MKILPFYCGTHGKIRVIEEYALRYFRLKRLNDIESANVVLKVIKTKIQHVYILGEVVLRLGINAEKFNVFDGYYFVDAEKNCSSNEIVADCIAKEMNSVLMLKRLNESIVNQTVKELIDNIIFDDEQNVNFIKNRLKTFIIEQN